MTTSAARTIKSARRVLEILEYFDQDRRHATVMDMSRDLGYPQSSTSELLRCLTRLGYLHYNRFRRTFSPTARVALLGVWVNPALFRGGPMLSMIDSLAQETQQTVVLSTASNYEVQHLHVIQGERDDAVELHAGDTSSLLHSPQGRLLMSSYRTEHIRSALHRLNAEEADPERRVNVVACQAELTELRMRGWSLEHFEDGCVHLTAILPARRGMDRLVLSVIVREEAFAEKEDMLRVALLRHRDDIAKLEDELLPPEPKDNVIHIPDSRMPPSYHRHYA